MGNGGYLLALIASKTLGSTSVEVSPSSRPSATSRSRRRRSVSVVANRQLRSEPSAYCCAAIAVRLAADSGGCVLRSV